ncbi:hypothetical protein O181_037492 [Austropuccinia psidii MF-1]|uniref:Integrase catalytic domain-containing protein n=1 Tax=Austropuccinia psidii MF-1 TaxID=1389203 RepID=A0A9Q3DCT4_9BASI|nr:hypothetical protein [Austropuccinia psidii MF-1]
MDWVRALPPSGRKHFNSFLVIVDIYNQTPIFFPCHKYDTAMHTALLICKRVISHTGLINNIIRDRDPKLTTALWNNFHGYFGTKFSFSTAYHTQIDGIANRMIQTLEHMISRLCACVLEFKDTDCLTHYWHTRITELELSYKKSVHSSTGHTPAMLSRG